MFAPRRRNFIPLLSAKVDVVDVVLILLVASAAVHGLRLGAVVQVLTLGGFLVGMALGVLVAVLVVPSLHSGTAKIVVTLVSVLGLALIFGIGGRALGGWSHVVVHGRLLVLVDAVLGVGVGVAAVLLSAWLVASLLSQSSYPWLSGEIQRSDVLETMDRIMPPVPGAFARVESFLTSSGFPPVFAGLSQPTAPPVPLLSNSAANAIAQSAAGSTVKLIGQACNYIQEGSGFVVAPGMVVTNAHVVAGEPSTRVQVQGVTYSATTVLFDPSFDLAVLRTKAPLGPPLVLDPDKVGRGTRGVVLGYPEDGSLAVAPAGVAASLTASGRDIYNQGSVVRSVYQLDADVRPGNSGGPVVTSGGNVIAVVFSRSTVSTDVGYALASPGVLSRVRQAELRTAPVGTGACTQD
jgi:S1-C subfamily serine protease